jgi:hypothetical protein
MVAGQQTVGICKLRIGGCRFEKIAFAPILVVVPGYWLVLSSPDIAPMNRQAAPVGKNLDIAFTASDNVVG